MRAVPLIVVFWGWLSTPALAFDAPDWLERLANAKRHQSFSGVFVHGVAGGLSSHAVWQLAARGSVRERFLRLDGVPAEAIRVDGKIRCASDEYIVPIASDTGWQSARLDPATLDEGYVLKDLGEDRVAGRSVQRIAVEPRDQHRYRLELSLDVETALPLKALLLSESGQLLERYQYAQFVPGPVAPSQLESSMSCPPLSAAPPLVEAGHARWRSGWVPAGFRLLGSGVRSGPVGNLSVDWLTYGDGLAKFSVFVEPLEGGMPADERRQLGPTSVVSRRITVGDVEQMVTVVGEVPLGTVERIALSMRLSEGAP